VRCNFIALPVFGLRYNTSDVERKFGGSNTWVYCSPKTGSVMRLIRASNHLFHFPTCSWIALPPLHSLQPYPLPPAITAQMFSKFLKSSWENATKPHWVQYGT
jgi:hypothetical protein